MTTEDTRDPEQPQEAIDLRDQLLALFLAATRGDTAAGETLRQLGAWNAGEDRPPQLVLAGNRRVFQEWGELHPAFAGEESLLRDRARRYAAAWSWIQSDALAGKPLECARAAWDAGLFLEVHELVEGVWRDASEAERPALQGWILAATGLYRLAEGDLATAGEMLGEADPILRDRLVPEPYDWSAFATAIQAICEAIAGGEIRTAEDLRDIPRLEKSR